MGSDSVIVLDLTVLAAFVIIATSPDCMSSTSFSLQMIVGTSHPVAPQEIATAIEGAAKMSAGGG